MLFAIIRTSTNSGGFMTARAVLATAGMAAISFTGCLKFDGRRASDADCESGEFCSATSHSCIVRNVCSPACAAHTECANGACVSRYSALVITQPATDIAVRGDAAVSIAAQLEGASGRTANLPSSGGLDVG